MGDSINGRIRRIWEDSKGRLRPSVNVTDGKSIPRTSTSQNNGSAGSATMQANSSQKSEDKGKSSSSTVRKELFMDRTSTGTEEVDLQQIADVDFPPLAPSRSKEKPTRSTKTGEEEEEAPVVTPSKEAETNMKENNFEAECLGEKDTGISPRDDKAKEWLPEDLQVALIPTQLMSTQKLPKSPPCSPQNLRWDMALVEYGQIGSWADKAYADMLEANRGMKGRPQNEDGSTPDRGNAAKKRLMQNSRKETQSSSSVIPDTGTQAYFVGDKRRSVHIPDPNLEPDPGELGIWADRPERDPNIPILAESEDRALGPTVYVKRLQDTAGTAFPSSLPQVDSEGAYKENFSSYTCPQRQSQ
ncbi:hypothetical protein R1sor_015973 [Riccia sorocarpa]|uniref:Uncharacterized protein n=1 Tax=Riccia sorocarpa TaxID=122646 RepID=A0ABD3HHP5_9MARC